MCACVEEESEIASAREKENDTTTKTMDGGMAGVLEGVVEGLEDGHHDERLQGTREQNVSATHERARHEHERGNARASAR